MISATQYVLVALALAGIGYYLVCITSTAGFLLDRKKRRTEVAEFSPPVTILKPVRGVDPGAYENFRSHCLQDYPDYELIFGVGDANDAAIPLIERLRQEFPQRRIQLVICTQVRGTNRKVSNLMQMLAESQHPFVVINDGDIRVGRDYLRRVMAPFSSANVGMVTCLYHGIAAPTLGSRLEALGISTDFIAGVLTARQLEGKLRFALGSTLALRKTSLAAIGGLEPLVDYLADDYELGRRIAGAGFEVALSEETVETCVPAYSFAEFYAHQLRWARSTRDSRRWGYAGLALTFGLPWSLFAVLAAHGAPWSWKLLLVALVTRVLMAIVVGGVVLRDRQLTRDLILLPLRDLIALSVWIASFFGHKVSWRGSSFILENGKLRPVA